MTDLVPFIYHERQERECFPRRPPGLLSSSPPLILFESQRDPCYALNTVSSTLLLLTDSKLTAHVTGLNNLLQTSTFSAQDLAGIAQQLDQLEREQLEDTANWSSSN